MMAILFPDPFDALVQFQQSLDAFRTSGWLGSSPSASGAYPPINVFRKGDDIVVIAEVPGIKKSELQIQVKGNTIRIAGAKTVEYLPLPLVRAFGHRLRLGLSFAPPFGIGLPH